MIEGDALPAAKAVEDYALLDGASRIKWVVEDDWHLGHSAVGFEFSGGLDGPALLGPRQGESLLEDGHWVLRTETYCALMALGHTECSHD